MQICNFYVKIAFRNKLGFFLIMIALQLCHIVLKCGFEDLIMCSISANEGTPY